MIYKNNIYFSVATRTDLCKNKELGEKVLYQIFNFCQNEISSPLMLCYNDKRGFKKPKLTQRNIEKFIEKYADDQVKFLYVEDYCSADEYYAFQTQETYIDRLVNKAVFEFVFQGGCSLHRELGPCCDTVCISVSKKYLFENGNTDKFEKLLSLFKLIFQETSGIGAFMTHGSDEFHGQGLFDVQYYNAPSLFSSFWNEQVRGYFWLTFLTDKQIEILGGIEKLDGHGFYKIEKTDTGVFIQCTENILDYTREDALKLREVLFPLLPPIKERTSKLFPSIEDIGEHRLYLFDVKDMV